MWLMIGTAFLSQPPGLPPQTKPLNLSKEFCPLSLAFDMGHYPIADMSRPGEGTGHIRVAVGDQLGLSILSTGKGTILLGLWTHALNHRFVQARGTTDRIPISKLFFISSKCPMHLKLKCQFTRLWH
jgi:hypothetical protein